MSYTTTRIARIRYNLEFSGYEAIVFIQDAQDTFSYPSFIAAPLDADYALVMQQLADKAQRQHRSANPGLRSQMHRNTARRAQAPEHPPLAA
ncbi:hypothetical protein [Lentibacter sp.]|uniref:hypothetical protein n=1 Tax=Lentibacter sp. TaxID=2024994 RepID=UPI003F6C5F64